MSFYLQPYIDRAKTLVGAGDPQSLVYAALELRLGVEHVCYEKLRFRLGYVSLSDLKDWRPHRVVDVLQELADPDIKQDKIFYVGLNDDRESDPQDFAALGTQKGIDPKILGRIWQSLGSFLHVQMPRDRNAHIDPFFNAEVRRQKLLAIIGKLENITSSDLDFCLLEPYRFRCRCGEEIVRNAKALRDGLIIRCSNNSCKMEYVARDVNEKWRLEPHMAHINCPVPTCGSEICLSVREIFGYQIFTPFRVQCRGCGRRLSLEWMLRCRLPDDEPHDQPTA